MVQTHGDGEWDYSDTQNRFLYTVHGEIGTTLKRDFKLSSANYTAWDHKFRPYIQYNFIPDEDQAELPTFDGVDRITEKNAITYGIDNFFNLFGQNDSSREIGYLKISQSYDLRSEADEEPFSRINLKLGWTPVVDLSFIYKSELDIYGDDFVVHGLEGSYKNSRGDHLSVEYRYNAVSNIEQINADFWAQIFPTIFAGYKVQHSLSESQTIEQDISLLYKPTCWSVELTSHYTPGDHNMMLIFSLANIGNPLRLDL